MRLIFLILLTVFSQIILKEEKKVENKTEKESESKIVTEEYNEEEGYFPGNKTYDLNDLIFDHVIRNGEKYRWFVLFYSKTCGHCRRARKEINKLFDDFKSINTIRFAQMEAYDNTLTNVRFNITGVPYIILIENNSIFELDLFPNYENLKKFISTNFTEIQEELKPLPKKVKFAYVAWVIFKQTLDSITESFNKLLKRHNINIHFNPYAFIATVLLTIILCCTCLVKCCIYCCCNDEDIAKELKLLEEQYNLEMKKRKKEGKNNGDENQEEEGEEVEGEEIEGEEAEYEEGEEYEEEEDDEEEEEEKEDDDENKKETTEEEKKKEMTEEEKKKIEEEKEEELKKKEEEEKRKKQEEEEKRMKEEEENRKKEEEEKIKKEEDNEKNKKNKKKNKNKKKKD